MMETGDIQIVSVRVMKERQGFHPFRRNDVVTQNLLVRNGVNLSVAELQELLAMAKFTKKYENENKDLRAMNDCEKMVLMQRQKKVEEMSATVIALETEKRKLADENRRLNATLSEMTQIINQMEADRMVAKNG